MSTATSARDRWTAESLGGTVNSAVRRKPKNPAAQIIRPALSLGSRFTIVVRMSGVLWRADEFDSAWTPLSIGTRRGKEKMFGSAKPSAICVHLIVDK